MVGDCTVRALSNVMGLSWDEVYIGLVTYGYILKDMPSGNRVWQEYLNDNGYNRYTIHDQCPNCYRVIDFIRDHPKGNYILGTGKHVIAVKDGNYYDTWDSGREIVTSYWKKEKEY